MHDKNWWESKLDPGNGYRIPCFRSAICPAFCPHPSRLLEHVYFYMTTFLLFQMFSHSVQSVDYGEEYVQLQGKGLTYILL